MHEMSHCLEDFRGLAAGSGGGAGMGLAGQYHVRTAYVAGPMARVARVFEAIFSVTAAVGLGALLCDLLSVIFRPFDSGHGLWPWASLSASTSLSMVSGSAELTVEAHVEPDSAPRVPERCHGLCPWGSTPVGGSLKIGSGKPFDRPFASTDFGPRPAGPKSSSAPFKRYMGRRFRRAQAGKDDPASAGGGRTAGQQPACAFGFEPLSCPGSVSILA